MRDDQHSTDRIAASTFRSVLGHLPTGVTVVAAAGSDGTVGLTIGSFTSVSLDPPLVGFLVQSSSHTWVEIQRSQAFCANVLSTSQADLCWRFAKAPVDADRFEGVPWRTEATGSPVIEGAVAWIDCSIALVHETGDHQFVVGEVRGLGTHFDCGSELAPLIFCRGAIGGFTTDS